MEKRGKRENFGKIYTPVLALYTFLFAEEDDSQLDTELHEAAARGALFLSSNEEFALRLMSDD